MNKYYLLKLVPDLYSEHAGHFYEIPKHGSALPYFSTVSNNFAESNDGFRYFVCAYQGNFNIEESYYNVQFGGQVLGWIGISSPFDSGFIIEPFLFHALQLVNTLINCPATRIWPASYVSPICAYLQLL